MTVGGVRTDPAYGAPHEELVACRTSVKSWGVVFGVAA